MIQSREWKFISSRLGLLFFWILFCSLSGWAYASGPSDRSAASLDGGAVEKEKIKKDWFDHREFLGKGEWEKSKERLEKIYQWKLDQGIRNHYYYSLALLRESQQLTQGEPAVAELLNYAEKMAPDFSGVSSARARWLWSQIPGSWQNGTRAVWAWFQGIWRSFCTPEEALPQIANLSLGILLSFILTFLAFALSLLFRYYSLLAHHVKHLVWLDISSIPLFALTLLFLFSPFFLGLGWMWVLTLWILVFWVYQGRSDRRAAVVLLFLLLLLPTGIRCYSSFLLSLNSNGVPEILQASTGVWNGELYQRLSSMNRADPRDLDILQALGLVEKRMGKFSAAEGRFLKMAELDPPRSGSPLNNLGNIYLVTDRLDQAMEAYQKAAQLEPARGEAHYNLGQAYLLKLRMKEAEAEFERAKSLQPGPISYYTGISSRHPNRLVIDRTIDLSEIWRRILAPTSERDKTAKGLWSMLWGGVPLQYGEMALGALFLLLGMVHLGSRRLSYIRICERCGNVICSRCSHSRVIGTQCVQCLNSFVPHTSVDPEVVRKKRAAVARYRSWQTFFPQRISLFLPGGGHLIRGYTKEGILYLFVFTLFLTQVFLWGADLPDPLVLKPALSLPLAGIGAALFLLFYGLVQYRVRQILAEGGKSHFRKA
jgi:tetratricopeptide (TPR) repeat protein